MTVARRAPAGLSYTRVFAEPTPERDSFQAAVAGLCRGDFTASAPLFARHTPSDACPIIKWLEEGRFRALNIGAAGTFVIRQPVTEARLRAEVASKLPFDTEIVICQGREIVRLLSHDHFAGQPIGPDIVRFVSVLSKRPRSMPSMPISLPSSGRWLLKILRSDRRFILGLYRRHMKVIGYLGTFDRLFGVPVTTRNWNTIAAIARILGQGRPDRPELEDRKPEHPNKAFQPTAAYATMSGRGRRPNASRRIHHAFKLADR